MIYILEVKIYSLLLQICNYFDKPIMEKRTGDI